MWLWLPCSSSAGPPPFRRQSVVLPGPLAPATRHRQVTRGRRRPLPPVQEAPRSSIAAFARRPVPRPEAPRTPSRTMRHSVQQVRWPISELRSRRTILLRRPACTRGGRTCTLRGLERYYRSDTLRPRLSPLRMPGGSQNPVWPWAFLYSRMIWTTVSGSSAMVKTFRSGGEM